MNVRLTCVRGHARDVPNGTPLIVRLLRLCALRGRARCFRCDERISRVEEVVLS